MMMRQTRRPVQSSVRRPLPSAPAAPVRVLRIRFLGVLVAAVAVVVAFPLLLVWQSMTTLKWAKQNAQLQGEIEKIHVANALTRIRIDELLAPERIEQRARQQLGLVYPKPQQIVFVTADSAWTPLVASRPRSGGKESHATKSEL